VADDHHDLNGDSGDIFACPRCGTTVTERFWGPCQSCRSDLTARMRRQAEQIETQRFEPGMHVVPNHVATKD
jgi:hypothetical protein